MSVHITGLVYHQLTSRTRDLPPCDFDVQVLKDMAQAHENSGFDSVLVSQAASIPDPLILGAYLSAVTTRLQFLLAHRPGFIAPTMAARIFATIDQLSGGRATVHVISGAENTEMLRDGDSLSKDDRYHRSREYAQVLRKMWTSAEPIDFDGRFYKFRQAFCTVKPTRPAGLPISWAGASTLAFQTAGECADIFAMVGDTPDTARKFVEEGSREAQRHGRSLEFAITLCVILGETEQQAWDKAKHILARTEADVAARRAKNPTATPPKHASVAFQRMLENSQQADVVGRNVWMALNRVTGVAGNNTTLVGTPAQVIETLMDYYRLGFRRFLLRGFEPLEDAKEFGRELIPGLRRAVAQAGA